VNAGFYPTLDRKQRKGSRRDRAGRPTTWVVRGRRNREAKGTIIGASNHWWYRP